MNKFLEIFLEKKRFPPAALFIHGTVADTLDCASVLLETKKDFLAKGLHPDFHLYSPEEKSGLYSVAMIHSLLEKVGFAPFQSECKVCALLEVDKMLPSASNALLKILEEPPQDTFFILSTSDERALLPTLRSRLYPFYFSPPCGPLVDYSPLFTKVIKGEWGDVLEEISRIEEEKDFEPFFVAYLVWIKIHLPSSSFYFFVVKVSEMKQALTHYVRPKAVFLELLTLIKNSNCNK